MATGVQIATLVVAGVAALGGVSAALITAVATARREKNTWLRQRQVDCYEELARAVNGAINAVAGGAVDRALRSPDFPGLRESRTTVDRHWAALNNAILGLAVVGQPLTRRHAENFILHWRMLSNLAVPRDGSAHIHAQEVRVQALKRLVELRAALNEAMRIDQGIGYVGFVSRMRWWRTDASRSLRDARRFSRSPIVPPPEHPAELPPGSDAGTGHLVLQKWRVRTWDGSFVDDVEEGYLRGDVPWASLPVSHTSLQVPIAAMLRDIPGKPWLLAISSEMTADQVDIIEEDIARVILSHGQSVWPPRYADEVWVDGPSAGEQLYWWEIARIPQRSATRSIKEGRLRRRGRASAIVDKARRAL